MRWTAVIPGEDEEEQRKKHRLRRRLMPPSSSTPKQPLLLLRRPCLLRPSSSATWRPSCPTTCGERTWRTCWGSQKRERVRERKKPNESAPLLSALRRSEREGVTGLDFPLKENHFFSRDALASLLFHRLFRSAASAPSRRPILFPFTP